MSITVFLISSMFKTAKKQMILKALKEKKLTQNQKKKEAVFWDSLYHIRF